MDCEGIDWRSITLLVTLLLLIFFVWAIFTCCENIGIKLGNYRAKRLCKNAMRARTNNLKNSTETVETLA